MSAAFIPTACSVPAQFQVEMERNHHVKGIAVVTPCQRLTPISVAVRKGLESRQDSLVSWPYEPPRSPIKVALIPSGWKPSGPSTSMDEGIDPSSEPLIHFWQPERGDFLDFEI